MIKYYKSGTHYYKVDEDSNCCNPIIHLNKTNGFCINTITKISFYSNFFNDYEDGIIVDIEQEEFEETLGIVLLSLNVEHILNN